MDIDKSQMFYPLYSFKVIIYIYIIHIIYVYITFYVVDVQWEFSNKYNVISVLNQFIVKRRRHPGNYKAT